MGPEPIKSMRLYGVIFFRREVSLLKGNNFDESISIDEFYMRVQSKFPKLFPEENILMQTKKRLKFFLKPYYQKLKSFFDY